MFKIMPSPQYSDAILTLAKSGSVLSINGTPYDFSPLNDGDEIPADAITDQSIIGSITKYGGVINLTVLMPYSDPDAPHDVLYPQPITLVDDGKVIFNEKVQADD